MAKYRPLSWDDERALHQYLKAIGNEPLLTPADEVELAGRIRKGDQEALGRMTRANLRFVVSVAKQYANRGLEIGDLINEGNLGLIHAAERFDETRGCRFISYAVWWIRQRMLQAITEQSRVIRLPLNRVGVVNKISRAKGHLGQELMREPTLREVADRLDMEEMEVVETLKVANAPISLDVSYFTAEDGDPLIEILEDVDQPAADAAILEECMVQDVGAALKTLSPREEEVLTLYFGIGHDSPMTLEAIGDRINLTRERVRQIKEKAIGRLRHASRSRRLAAYLN